MTQTLGEAGAELLKKLYYDPTTGFVSVKKLYAKAKLQDDSITYKIVKEFLNNQTTQQQFKRQTQKHYYPIANNAYNPFQRMQIDLLSMQNEEGNNYGHNYVFVAIDIYTRYVVTVNLKTKGTKECVDALQKVIDVAKAKGGFTISQLDSDSESSFKSAEFKDLCKKHKITQHFVTINDKYGVRYVERMNYTIRNMYNRYKNATGKNDWIHTIALLIENYNNSVHSVIKTTPEKAIIDNPHYWNSVAQRFRTANDANKRPFTIGDNVRLQLSNAKFTKGSTEKYTQSVHKIVSFDNGEFVVTDRVKTYKPYEMMKITKSVGSYQLPPRQGLAEGLQDPTPPPVATRSESRRIQRRINKEGLHNHESNIITDENAKITRQFRSQRDFGPVLTY